MKTFKDSVSTKVNEAVELTAVKPILPKELSSDIVNFLTERIADEYTAHYFYRNAANWCKNVNYKKAAAFFEAEANSELDHAKGLQDYLTQWNIFPTIPSAPSNANNISLVDIINKAYTMEYGLFEKYSSGQMEFDKTHAATFNFLQGYVNIQNDAIGEYSDMLNALQLINTENKFEILYFENEYLG
jgi:ferritin